MGINTSFARTKTSQFTRFCYGTEKSLFRIEPVIRYKQNVVKCQVKNINLFFHIFLGTKKKERERLRGEGNMLKLMFLTSKEGKLSDFWKEDEGKTLNRF